MTRRLLLIGLDGADPRILSSLLDAGALPQLRALVERGAWGPLRAGMPLSRAMQWGSLATGRRSPRHGITAALELRPDGAGVRPTSHASWRAPAVWELLSQQGKRCVVVGWPATSPAVAWDGGIIVDDSFAKPMGLGYDAWPLPPDAVAPFELRDTLRELRVHPADITGEQLLAIVPEAKRIDQDNDPRLIQVALSLAHGATVHAAATHLAQRRDWDFMAVAYTLLADLQREFLRCRPPRLADVSDEDVAIFGEVVDNAYRMQDAMLGVLLRDAGDVDVVVASPYGFATGADRPSAEAMTSVPLAIRWHRRNGFLLAAGEGIPRDALIHGARVEDVAPTILALQGLEAALDGRRLAAISPPGGPLVAIEAPLRDGDAVDEEADAPPEDEELDDTQRKAIFRIKLATCINLAEAHLANGDPSAAATEYTRALQLFPDDWLAKSRLAQCKLQLREFDACHALATEVAASAPEQPWGHLLRGAALALGGDLDDARQHLDRARVLGKSSAEVALRVGSLQMVRKDYAEAEQCFREALVLAPGWIDVHDGLGCALFAQRRFEEAVEAFRTGLGHTYHAPATHVHLGTALVALGRYEEAATAVAAAESQDPRTAGLAELRERIASAGRPSAVAR